MSFIAVRSIVLAREALPAASQFGGLNQRVSA
jgi:hypothetical protein